MTPAIILTRDDDGNIRSRVIMAEQRDEADPLIANPFPAFTTPAPPPAGGVPPPPTFPPTGTNHTPIPVPVGPVAVPEPVVPAAVPPSVAGVTQPQFKTGSKTAPPANGYFPQFTTTSAYAGFPNHPPAGVPIVFTNTFQNAGVKGQVPPWGTPPTYDIPVPPSTPTVAQITLNGFAPFPALSAEPQESARVGAVHSGHARPAKRRGRAVLSDRNNHAEH